MYKRSRRTSADKSSEAAAHIEKLQNECISEAADVVGRPGRLRGEDAVAEVGNGGAQCQLLSRRIQGALHIINLSAQFPAFVSGRMIVGFGQRSLSCFAALPAL